ncbi:T9SS type A sorting domain-containing protein [Pricia sp.]|uniref:T9SS type A sorting domain-containing protein n=1 Tax=Pricia sp. TaxID=2268138 RepID=UPI0035947113
MNSVIVLAAQDSVSQNAILQDTTLVAAALIDSIPQISEDLEEAVSISLHPNPFVDRITLTIDGFMSESEENYHFELYDLAGNLLNTGQVGNRQEEILLNSIPKGIYILLLYKNEKEIESFKLIQSNQ